MPKRVYDRAYASVRFWADNLDPLKITLALRLPPDHTHRDGEPRLQRVKSGQVKEYAPYRGGMWSMSSKNCVQSPRLAVHLEWLLRELEPMADVVRSLLADGIQSDFFCAVLATVYSRSSGGAWYRHRDRSRRSFRVTSLITDTRMEVPGSERRHARR